MGMRLQPRGDGLNESRPSPTLLTIRVSSSGACRGEGRWAIRLCWSPYKALPNRRLRARGANGSVRVRLNPPHRAGAVPMNTGHVFLPTSRDKNRCHLCLKPKDHTDHISEAEAEKRRREKRCFCGSGLANGLCTNCWPQ